VVVLITHIVKQTAQLSLAWHKARDMSWKIRPRFHNSLPTGNWLNPKWKKQNNWKVLSVTVFQTSQH